MVVCNEGTDLYLGSTGGHRIPDESPAVIREAKTMIGPDGAGIPAFIRMVMDQRVAEGRL